MLYLCHVIPVSCCLLRVNFSTNIHALGISVQNDCKTKNETQAYEYNIRTVTHTQGARHSIGGDHAGKMLNAVVAKTSQQGSRSAQELQEGIRSIQNPMGNGSTQDPTGEKS